MPPTGKPHIVSIKTNIDSSTTTKANAALNQYIKGATGAAEKADRFGKVQTALDKATRSLEQGLSKVNQGLSSFPLITGGVTLGFGKLITQAWDMVQRVMQMRSELKHLSDTSGNVSSAWGVMTGAWSNSIASLATIRGTMTGLAAAGMQVGPAMKNLTTFVADLHQASGISAEKMAQLTGELHSYWGVSVKGSREVISSVLAAQKAFGSTTAQMEQFMGAVAESQNRLGALAIDGEASAKALAKGITMASGALVKLGVNAQVATSFMDKLMDPERFDETSGLLRRIGISVEDQFKMMETAGGKEMFFDKLLANLPKLASEIQSISNPLARFRYAKGIGLPPEIAMKMASASAGQMQTIIAEYKSQAQDEKAASEKRKQAQMDAARFDDQIQFMKMKILGPMMDFVMKMYGRLQGFGQKLSSILEKLVGWIADGMSRAMDAFMPVIDALTKGEKISGVIGQAVSDVITVVLNKMKEAWPVLKPIVVELMKGAVDAFLTVLKDHPLLVGGLLGGKLIGSLGSILQIASMFKGGGLGLLSKVGGLGKMFTAGRLGAQGIESSPMVMQGLSKLGGGKVAQFLGKGALGLGGRVGGVAAMTAAGAAGTGLSGATGALGVISKIGPILGHAAKFLGPIGWGITAVMAAIAIKNKFWADKALSEQDERERLALRKKRMFNQQLTKEEVKREKEIMVLQSKNRTSIREGFINIGKWFADLPKMFGEIVDKIGNKVGDIWWWFHDKVLFPMNMALEELGSLIAAKLTLPGQQRQEAGRYAEIVEEIQDARYAGNISRLKQMSKYSKIGGVSDQQSEMLKHLAYVSAQQLERQMQRDKEAAEAALEEQKKTNKQLYGIGGSLQNIDNKTPEKKVSESSFLQSFIGSYGLASMNFKAGV